jgi:ribose/xylose/arabinose/galactoside ABC-type transport system permease subunit
VHFLWEVVLLLAVAVLAFLVHRDYPATLRDPALDTVLVSGAAIGLLALGAGLTLRAGVPNLAIGPVAIASALHFAENGDRGVVSAMAPAAVAAALLGLVVALLVVGFQLPGWAVSLAAALGAIVFIQQRVAPVDVQGDYDPTGSAPYLFGGVAALALLGGLLGAIRPIRRAVGRFRPVGDPARRRGGFAAVVVTLATVTSMIFAMLAGVLLAAGGNGPVRPTSGLEWTGLALGVALLAGTSAFGRRGGVFGTLLAVVLLTLFITYAAERELRIALAATAAVTLAGGLLVTWLIETYGRPRPVTEVDDAWRREPAEPAEPSWSTPRTERSESWSSSLPAQPSEHRVDPWDPDRWSGPAR